MKNLLFSVSIFFTTSIALLGQQVDSNKQQVNDRRGQAVDIATPDSLLNKNQTLHLRQSAIHDDEKSKQPQGNESNIPVDKKTTTAIRNDN